MTIFTEVTESRSTALTRSTCTIRSISTSVLTNVVVQHDQSDQSPKKRSKKTNFVFGKVFYSLRPFSEDSFGLTVVAMLTQPNITKPPLLYFIT